MKKFYQIAFVLCSALVTQYGYSQECCPSQNYGGPSYGGPVANESFQDNGTVEQAACPADQPTGEYWCQYAKYDACYSNNWRCVEEPYTVQKKCCRMVPQQYEVQKCRYVPQYYTETACRQVPEYYCVDQCLTKKRWVCDKKCRYVPRYYYKKVCLPQEAAAQSYAPQAQGYAAPQQGGCCR